MGGYQAVRRQHIKANFFFIKDRVDDKKIKVIHCPTEER
jgi:hypothetical protein